MSNNKILNNKALERLPSGVLKPGYDRARLTVGIVHIGIGAFHRAHQAWYMDKLFSRGLASGWAICGIGLLKSDQHICDVLERQDGLYCLKISDVDGADTVQVVGSVTEIIFAPANPERAIRKMADPATKIISLTITEGGYNFSTNKQFDWSNQKVLRDAGAQDHPETVFGYLHRALMLRRDQELGPITIQSCDNMESNGDITRTMLLAFLSKAQPDLIPWVEEHVSFPNSMVDRITPATSDALKKEIIEDYGVIDGWPVNCEDFAQWVIEDKFKAGRPQWELAGAQIVPDVAPYEKMKIRLLNGGHTLAGFAGYHKGYNYIHESVNDITISRLLRKYLDKEVTPTLDPVAGIDLERYKESIIRRFKNPHIKDTVARIISETSAKFPKFILPTITDQISSFGEIELAALVAANWYQYLRMNMEHPGRIQDSAKLLLLERVREAERRNDPSFFLESRDLFGDLQKAEAFRDIFLHHLLQSILKN